MAAPGAALGGPAQLFSLLRGILRLHRQRLPPPMRSMGDTYVLSEFRRHLKGGTTEAQWRTFAAEWQRYAAMLGGTADQTAAAAPDPRASGPGASAGGVTAAIGAGGADMTEQLLEQLSADQRRQLIRLQQEARALGAEMLGRRGDSGGDGGGGSPP